MSYYPICLSVSQERTQYVETQLVGGAHEPVRAAEQLVRRITRATDKVGHVEQQPDNWHVDLVEHGHALARVDERDVLRRRDDDRACCQL